MKRFLAILMAAMMMMSLCVISASAATYDLKLVYSEDFENITAADTAVGGTWQEDHGDASDNGGHTGLGVTEAAALKNEEASSNKVAYVASGFNLAMHGKTGTNAANAVLFDEGVFEFDYYFDSSVVQPGVYYQFWLGYRGLEYSKPWTLKLEIYPNADGNGNGKIGIFPCNAAGNAYHGSANGGLVAPSIKEDVWQKMRIVINPHRLPDQYRELFIYVCDLENGEAGGKVTNMTQLFGVNLDTNYHWAGGADATNAVDNRGWNVGTYGGAPIINNTPDGNVDVLNSFRSPSAATNKKLLIDNIKVYEPVSKSEEKETAVDVFEKNAEGTEVTAKFERYQYTTFASKKAVDVAGTYTAENELRIYAVYNEDGTLANVVKVDTASIAGPGTYAYLNETLAIPEGGYAKMYKWELGTLKPLAAAADPTVEEVVVPDEPEEPEEPKEEQLGDAHAVYNQYTLQWKEDFQDYTALDTYDPAGTATTGPFSMPGANMVSGRGPSIVSSDSSILDSDLNTNGNKMWRASSNASSAIHGIMGTASAKAVAMAEGVLEFDFLRAGLMSTDNGSNTVVSFGAPLSFTGTFAGAPTGFIQLYMRPTQPVLYVGATANRTNGPMSGTLTFTAMEHAGTGVVATPALWQRHRLAVVPNASDSSKVDVIWSFANYEGGLRSGTLGDYTVIAQTTVAKSILEASYKTADTQKWSANALNATVADGSDNEVDAVICFQNYGSSTCSAYIDNFKFYGPAAQ